MVKKGKLSTLRYYEKYDRYEEIYLVGIVIDSKERKTKNLEIEKYQK